MMNPPSPAVADPGVPELRRAIALGLRWWRLAAVVAGILVATTAFATLLRSRRWSATTRLIPQETSSSLGSLGGLAAQLGVAIPSTGSQAQSPAFYAQLLQSKVVLRAVTLATYDLPDQAGRGSLLEYFRIDDSDSAAAIRRGVQKLREVAAISTDRSTGLVTVAVSTTSPQLSVQVAQRFLDFLNEFNLERRQSSARAEREFVEARMRVARDSLRAVEGALTDFYRRNRSYQASPELVAEEARLQRLVSIHQQVYLGLSQRYEAARIEEVRDTPVITVVDPPGALVTPVSRGLPRKAVMALLTGVVLALGLAWLVETLEERAAAAHTEDGVTTILAKFLPVAGAIRRLGGTAIRAA